MNKSLIIRADAGARMGTGHVMRCIALGQAWQDAGGSVTFISCCDLDQIRQRIIDEKFELVELEQAYPESTIDIETTINICAEYAAGWLVLDGYHFDISYQQAVRRAGLMLLSLDDYNHLSSYEVDILLNQNAGAESIHYECNTSATKMLGSDYAMLRREFREKTEPINKQPEVAENILVTLGGADFGDCIRRIINGVGKVDCPQFNLKVLIGAANLHINDFRDIADRPGCNIELLKDVRNMPELMQWADVCISAGGSTCWELGHAGVPTLLIALVENQQALSEELDRRGVMQYLGWHTGVTVEKITETLQCLLTDKDARTRLAEAAVNLIDGFGVERVLHPLAKQVGLDFFNGRLNLRCAQEDDMELLWNWANDPGVRANSYNPDLIPLASHQKWYSLKLNSDDCRMWLLELDGIPVGQIRYERTAADVAEIGFSIDRHFRRLGLGSSIISMSLDEAFSQLRVTEIHASVFQSNRPSQSTFLKTGFEDDGECVIKDVPSRIYKRKRM